MIMKRDTNPGEFIVAQAPETYLYNGFRFENSLQGAQAPRNGYCNYSMLALAAARLTASIPFFIPCGDA